MTHEINNSQKLENLEALISIISFKIVNEKILDETEINKLLGVLSSNGVYAMWVYALDKLETSFKVKKDDNHIERPQIFKFLLKLKPLLYKVYQTCFIDGMLQKEENKRSELEQKISEIESENLDEKEKRKRISKEKNKIIDFLTKELIKESSIYYQLVSKDIHKLLFLKQLLEKTLTYARYNAKALDGE